MASDGNDQDAEYALSKLLKIVKPQNSRQSFFISPCGGNTLREHRHLGIFEVQSFNFGRRLLQSSYPEARFEIIAKEDKAHIIEKKIDIILPLEGEFASPKAKGSLNADEYISVEEVVDGGEALGIGEDDDLGDAATDGGDDAVESGDILILNSLIGHGSETLLCENMCALIASDIQGLRKKVDLYMLMMKGMLRRQQQQQQIATVEN
ncbi:hypothetical protein Tco_1114320 [Tanacetum coccineum]|uniref:Uncharacterized protein n=1 Tax=Tanacetum coccineum TaxID=301880 RepID=A0ABQ5IUR8_9ASTR